jgi:hypothetical protein
MIIEICFICMQKGCLKRHADNADNADLRRFQGSMNM